MAPEISKNTTIKIKSSGIWWHTVEDVSIDLACDGCTISYWELDSDSSPARITSICTSKETALAIADSIYKLFKPAESTKELN